MATQSPLGYTQNKENIDHISKVSPKVVEVNNSYIVYKVSQEHNNQDNLDNLAYLSIDE